LNRDAAVVSKNGEEENNLEWAVRIGTAYQDEVKPQRTQRLVDFSCNTLCEMQDIEVAQKSKLLFAKLHKTRQLWRPTLATEGHG